MREHLAQLGRAHEDIREAGGEAIAVFQYESGKAGDFCADHDVPFACFGDPERRGYGAVGLTSGGVSGWREYLGPQLIKGMVRAARRGAFLGIPKGDISLRPGTFVVDPEGKVALAYYNRDSDDHPAMESLLEAVRGARGATAATR